MTNFKTINRSILKNHIEAILEDLQEDLKDDYKLDLYKEELLNIFFLATASEKKICESDPEKLESNIINNWIKIKSI